MTLIKAFTYYLIILFFSIPYFVFSQQINSSSYSSPATDALGRKLPTHAQVGDLKKDKFVGLFYWTWHTQQSKHNPPYNTTEFLAKDPKAIEDYNNPIWPKSGSFFWSEPLFGYYIDTDRWVLRKHAEMLADAGVDVIIFDCTNGNITWKESYMKLCEVFTQARKDGVPTPKIAFMLPFWMTPGAKEIIKELYTELYKPSLYKDLWFYWKGKPLIMAMPEVAMDSINTKINYEMKDFFTFRPGQPVYDKGPERPDHWGWLEIYPQHGFATTGNGKFEQATVGVAQNWSKERGLTAMNAPNVFNRNYTDQRGPHTEPGAVNFGYNFQEQWDRALEIDPEFIFITGWNEWIAGRYEMWQGQANAFPDEFDQAGSRDIEPMKGGHQDNYYYQMVSNIRKFKGMPKPMSASTPQTILIDGNFTEWKSVQPAYHSYKGNTLHRNSPGWGDLKYVNNSGRNDIVLSKVARDAEYIYFYVEAAATLTPQSDPGWMRLFIDIDRNKSTGWEGYDYVINRLNPKAKAILEKSKNGWNWKYSKDLDYKVNANAMEIKIPRSLLTTDGKLDFEFKWSDNMQKEGDISDFIINGDVAPGGRFNYHYSASK